MSLPPANYSIASGAAAPDSETSGAEPKKRKRRGPGKAPIKHRKTRAVLLRDVRKVFTRDQLRHLAAEVRAALAAVREGSTEREYTFHVDGVTYTIHAAELPLRDFLWRIGEPQEGPTVENTEAPEPAAADGPGAEERADVPPAAAEPEADSGGNSSGSAAEAPHLSLWTQTLRDYQEDCLADAAEFVQECWDGKHEVRRRLYAAPTGTGKGTTEIGLLKGLVDQGVDAWILTPSLEVLRGFLERCGLDREALSETSAEKLAELGERIRCTTPTRFRNRVLDGAYTSPEVVIYDEVHHAVWDNEVSGTLFAVAPEAVWLGFTATPYRGTPKGTQQLREAWGEPVLVFTIPEAVAAGYQSLPRFEVVGLVDDDRISVKGGEFNVRGSSKVVGSRLKDLAALIEDRVRGLPADAAAGDTVPTAVTVPSRAVAGDLVEALDALGVPARMVIQQTKAKDRARAYEECRQGLSVLVSVKVLVEGVDMPWLRRLIDARPTMSPVAWVQQIGRIMRPGPTRPEYICVCRNLERHAYLLGGAVPREAVAQAQEEFEAPSKRTGARSIGLESLKRFKAIKLPLAGGGHGTMNALYSVNSDTGQVTEFVALLDPCQPEPLCARRTNVRQLVGEGDDAKWETKQYGKWEVCDLPTELEGFASSKWRTTATKKQKQWWERAAARHGLDPGAAEKLTGRQFQALPVLADTRRSLIPEVA